MNNPTDTANPAARQQQAALLLTLVGQLRAIREAEGRETFAETVASFGDIEGGGVLAEVAADLDAATPAEVDAELRRLWAGVLSAAVSA